MSVSALALIGVTIVVSSFISGVFGMAGGMVLLGVLLVYFDVATGMVLFSILQITANGWRALHWRRFVLWPIFYWYVAGSILAFVVMRSIAYVPDKAREARVEHQDAEGHGGSFFPLSRLRERVASEASRERVYL